MQISIGKNTTTNYLVILVRLFQGIYVTRWMVNFLGDSQYGLWSVLWSFFAYAILVDFGFGISAQKFTSLELFKSDIRRYNSVVSMIFSFQCLMSLVMVAAIFVASFFLPELFKVTDPEKLAYCRKCFFMFSLGTAAIFPLCIFSEIMVGLHKIYVKNYIDTVSRLCELFGFLIVLKCGGGLFGVIVFDIILMGAERSFTGFCVSRFIPGFRLRFHLFDKDVFRQIFGFSSGTYLISIAKLLRSRMSEPLTSGYLGLAQAGILHFSSRLSDMCNQAISQYNGNVRPISAQLFHRNKFAMLCTFVKKSMQWNMFMACLIVVPAIFLTDEATRVLFDRTNTDAATLREIHWLSILSLIGTLVASSISNIPHSVLLMCEKHHLMAVITMTEAVVVVLMMALCLEAGLGVWSVVAGPIVISLFLGFCIMLPVMIRIVHGRYLPFLVSVYLPSILCSLPAVVLLLALKKVLGGHVNDFWMCALCGTSYAVVFMLLSWRFQMRPATRALYLRRANVWTRKHLPRAARLIPSK
jgi:O-antigen/teichoic acid export membrane protein